MYFNFTLMALAALFLSFDSERKPKPRKPRRGWRLPLRTDAARPAYAGTRA